jgi:hypothetical protein
MKLRTQYFFLTLGLFIATFLTFFLLGRDPIDSLGFAIGNACLFITYLAIMVKFGMWKI